jgi:putative endonuclease
MTISDRLTRAQLGVLGEQLAAQYLLQLKWAVLQRNWRCRYGELDIIAVDGETLVFVEVKTRTGDGFGGVEHAVTPQKLRRIRRLAGLWLAGQQLGWKQIRIDVLGVRFGRRPEPEFLHLRGVG